MVVSRAVLLTGLVGLLVMIGPVSAQDFPFYLTDVAWSAGGETLAVAHTYGVWLYDAADLEAAPRRLQPEPGRVDVRAVAFSPDGRLLATTEFDLTENIPWLTLYDAESLERLGRYADYDLSEITFTSDSQTLLFGTVSGAARIISVPWLLNSFTDAAAGCVVTAPATARLRQFPSRFSSAVGSLSAGETLTVNGGGYGDDGFIWWRATVDARRLYQGSSWVRSDLVTASEGCQDAPILIEPTEWANHSNHLPGDIAVSETRGLIASINFGGDPSLLSVWDLKSGALIRTVAPSARRVPLGPGSRYPAPFAQQIDFLPDGATLAAADPGNSAKPGLVLFNLDTGAETQVFERSDAIAWSVAAAPSGGLVAFGMTFFFRDGGNRSEDRVFLYETAGGSTRTLYEEPTSYLLTDLSFSPNGSRLAVISVGEPRLLILDVASGSVLARRTIRRAEG